MKHRFAPWSLVLGIYLFLALLSAGQTYVFFNLILEPHAPGKPHPPGEPPAPGGLHPEAGPPAEGETPREGGPFTMSASRALVLSLGEWVVWLGLTPAVVALARRFPVRGGLYWPWDLARHLGIASLCLIIKAFSDAVITWWLGGPIPPQPFFSRFLFCLTTRFHINLLVYGGILGGYYASIFYQKFREREWKTAQLEAQLAQAQLQVLKMQLHPHFLFNTLNAISSLIYKDAEAAERMITNLSELLRYTLDNIGVQEIPLREEIHFLQRYLEIEQTRFHDRLTIEYDIDPESLEAMVPTMIFQPLVENSIRHGIAKRASAGKILIQIRRRDPVLQLTVEDNGAGGVEKPAGEAQNGIGLLNTKQRLQQLYGPAHQFAMRFLPRGGVQVVLEIPYRAAGAPAEEQEEEPVLEDTRVDRR
ncbi:MAG: sensor histidine kinase [bacterium]